MSTQGVKKWAMLLTFWLALHTASLRAQTVLYSGTSPAVLQMEGTSGILESIGTYGTGSLSLSGGGTRMIWYPGKAAFRAGWVYNSNWDDANIGSLSVAIGNNELASGYCSTAFGSWTTASSAYSTALGISTVASNWYALATGNSTEASGPTAVAFGNYTTASGNTATTFGSGTTASASNSIAAGWYTTASSYEEFVVGQFNEGGGSPTSWVSTDPLFEVGNGTDASHKHDALLLDKSGNLTVHTVRADSFVSNGTAIGTMVFGGHTSASGYYAAVLGYYSQANGLASTAFGYDNIANNTGATAFGAYSNANGWASTASGGYVVANGMCSTASGFYTTADGDDSAAFGFQTTATAVGSFVVGMFNVGGGNPTTPASNDLIFEVGNGGSAVSPSDALSVDRSGNVVAGGVVSAHGTMRCAAGGDISMGAYTSGTAP